MSDSSPELPDYARLDLYPTNTAALAEIMDRAATEDGLSRLPTITRQGETRDLECLVLRPAIRATKTTEAQPMYVAFRAAETVFVASVQSDQAGYAITNMLRPDGEYAYWIADTIDTSERSLRTLGGNFGFYKMWAECAQHKPEASVDALLSAPQLRSIKQGLEVIGLAQQLREEVAVSALRTRGVGTIAARARDLGIWELLLETYPGLRWFQRRQEQARHSD